MILRSPVFLEENSSSIPHSLDAKAAKSKKAGGVTYWSHLEIIIGGEYNDDVLCLGFNSLFDLLCSISDMSTIFVIAAICRGFIVFKAAIYCDYTPRGLHQILSQRSQKSSGVWLKWPIVLLAGLWKKAAHPLGLAGWDGSRGQAIPGWSGLDSVNKGCSSILAFTDIYIYKYISVK